MGGGRKRDGEVAPQITESNSVFPDVGKKRERKVVRTLSFKGHFAEGKKIALFAVWSVCHVLSIAGAEVQVLKIAA